MKKIVSLIFIFLLLCGCGKKNPIVTMDVENFGIIEIELYPDIAPNTVANFVNLIESGFYDGNTIHRVVPNFVIQGGDPDGNGTGGPGYNIKGEFSQNGFTNKLSHDRGVISMARGNDADTAGSQFFIVLDNSAKTSLDEKYASFGKVIKGMDVVDKIAKSEVANEESGLLKELITIKKVTVETFEQKYKVKKITPTE